MDDQQVESKQHKRSSLPTLVAVLVVLGMVFVLMPAFFYIPHDHDHALKPEAQVRILCQALILHAADHKDQFLDMDRWGVGLVEAGLIEAGMLISQTSVSDGDSYFLVAKFNSLDSTEILLYENPEHWIDFVIVGFADAHVEMVDHETFERMLAEQIGSD
ncbi:hypothetical protein COB72_01790 [bacterium]|nr:MAG: hypothetical protein COB72_01790 [bacterium]